MPNNILKKNCPPTFPSSKKKFSKNAVFFLSQWCNLLKSVLGGFYNIKIFTFIGIFNFKVNIKFKNEITENIRIFKILTILYNFTDYKTKNSIQKI